MTKLISIAVALTSVFSVFGAELELPGFVYVGEIPLGCGQVVNGNKPVKVPEGFKVTPDEAMNLATSKAKLRCNSKLQQVVYADSKNYYIFDSVLLPLGNQAAHSGILVDGQSGSVTDNRGI